MRYQGTQKVRNFSQEHNGTQRKEKVDKGCKSLYHVEITVPQRNRAEGSILVDMHGVDGSNPLPPIRNYRYRKQLRRRFFFDSSIYRRFTVLAPKESEIWN